jgi:hypothetical protein
MASNLCARKNRRETSEKACHTAWAEFSAPSRRPPLLRLPPSHAPVAVDVDSVRESCHARLILLAAHCALHFARAVLVVSALASGGGTLAPAPCAYAHLGNDALLVVAEGAGELLGLQSAEGEGNASFSVRQGVYAHTHTKRALIDDAPAWGPRDRRSSSAEKTVGRTSSYVLIVVGGRTSTCMRLERQV